MDNNNNCKVNAVCDQSEKYHWKQEGNRLVQLRFSNLLSWKLTRTYKWTDLNNNAESSYFFTGSDYKTFGQYREKSRRHSEQMNYLKKFQEILF